MDKYQPLRDQGTNGVNCNLDTEAIIARLRDWDAKYGVELSDIASDRVNVQFKTLPDDVGGLADEVYDFCPDVVDQHFGCIAEAIDAMEEMEQEIPPHLQELTEGVDLEDENYGLELLKRSLKRDKSVALWWD